MNQNDRRVLSPIEGHARARSLVMDGLREAYLMTLRISALMTTVFIGLLVASQAVAQGGPGKRGGGWGPGSAYGRMYDVKTVEAVQGQVVAVERFEPGKGMSPGVHLQVQTDKGRLSVHLGPAWYLDRQDVQIAVGDRIKVKGSRIEFNGRPAVVAAEVQRGDETLTLRDENGHPAWSGWRRR
jgi:hypothetical protein